MRERLQVRKVLEPAPGDLLSHVRERLVEPTDLELLSDTARVTLARVDHVLEFVRDGSARTLTHRRSGARISVLEPGRIGGEQIKDLGLVAVRAGECRCRRHGGEEVAAEEEATDEAAALGSTGWRQLVDSTGEQDDDALIVVYIRRRSEPGFVSRISDVVELGGDRVEIRLGEQQKGRPIESVDG